MSYAIVRNEKLTRSQAQGICVHNDRKAKNHSNKEIDISKTHLNYYIKKNKLNYVKEFDKLKEENNLKGQIRSNSIIICEIIFTSDQAFFDKIGEKETKRYFKESYDFICKYKNLGELNVISAVVHLDEGTPHMHLIFLPVVHTKDKDGKEIDKICARDFWKGRDSYRKLQDAYFNYVRSKGFDLERGMFVEDTNRKHYTIEEYKKITNYDNTKKVLNDIKLELPNVPDINDIKVNRLSKKRDERILEEIIKPKDDLIKELYKDNLSLHKELSKQSKVIDEAQKYQKERNSIIADNQKLHNTVKNLKNEYIVKKKTLENEFKDKSFDLEYEYKHEIHKLEKENNHLKKVINKFKETTKKFIKWICKKFDLPSEDEIIRDFEKETYTFIDAEKQIAKQEKFRDYEIEL